MSERIEEWLLAAEYILAHGNPNVMFCERGIRTFETYTRNTLDLAAVAIIKKETPPAGHHRSQPGLRPRRSGARPLRGPWRWAPTASSSKSTPTPPKP